MPTGSPASLRLAPHGLATPLPPAPESLGLPVESRANGGNQFGRSRVFEHVARGAGFERAPRVGDLRVHGEKDHPHPSSSFFNCLERLDAV